MSPDGCCRRFSEISDAAGHVAAGDLTTRFESVGDPDLNQLIQSFNAMTSSLQERIERDSRFASDVSHELRSPLMTLTGSVAVIERRREDMPERAQLALDLLSTDIRRFKLLVEDLLEISRFDVGAVQLDIEEVMLGEFVRQAIGAAVAANTTSRSSTTMAPMSSSLKSTSGASPRSFETSARTPTNTPVVSPRYVLSETATTSASKWKTKGQACLSTNES